VAISLLKKEVRRYKVPGIDLIAAQSKDPFNILAAKMLSARTRDSVTASSCRKLFKQVDTDRALESLSRLLIEKLIYPVKFYRNKARYLKSWSSALDELFDDIISEDVKSLTKLPGVGRKTANLVVTIAFRKPASVCDTHARRIVNIWGYVKTDTSLKTELALRKRLPEKHGIRLNSILVAFGQQTCKPARTHCDRCVIEHICPGP
jgi:exodeoxyribonuclease-3